MRNLYLISVEAFAALPATPAPLLLDVRLGKPEDTGPAYLAGHLPGAVATTVNQHFASPPTQLSGSLPLPAPVALQADFDAWGLTADRLVIVYSDNPAAAARAWWTLRWAGVQSVKVLDGGLQEWTRQGGKLEQGEAASTGSPQTSRTLQVKPGQEATLDYDKVPAFVAQGAALLDARPADAYGSVAASTHIPGARNVPAGQLWDEHQKLRSEDELRAILGVAATDAQPVAAYCGGGVMASYEVLALRTLGVKAALYVGSWSEWSKRRAGA